MIFFSECNNSNWKIRDFYINPFICNTYNLEMYVYYIKFVWFSSLKHIL